MTLPLKTPRPRSPMMPRKFSLLTVSPAAWRMTRVVVDVLACAREQQAEQVRAGSRRRAA